MFDLNFFFIKIDFLIQGITIRFYTFIVGLLHIFGDIKEIVT